MKSMYLIQEEDSSTESVRLVFLGDDQRSTDQLIYIFEVEYTLLTKFY